MIAGQQNQSQREVAIDMLKGFLMACIIFVHVSGDRWFVSRCLNTFKIGGFFFVVGYLLAKSKNISILHRIRRLMLPYLIFSVVTIGFRAALQYSGVFGDKVFVDVGKAFIHTCKMNGYLTLWFLPVLAIAETVVCLCLRAGPVLCKRIILAFAFVASVVAMAKGIDRMVSCSSMVVMVFARAIPGIGFIVAGYFAEPIVRMVSKKPIWYLALYAFISLVIGVLVSLNVSGIDWCALKFGNHGLRFLFSGLVLSIGLLFLFMFFERMNLTLCLPWIGRNSLFIMATHLAIPFIFVSTKIVEHLIPWRSYVVNDVLICIFVLAMEFPCVCVYNKLCSFALILRQWKWRTNAGK